MSIMKKIAAAAAGLMAFAGAAQAEDRQFTYSVTLSGTSDYIFRGVSTNAEDPAFQPSINFGYGIAYFGLWGSNNTGIYAPWETDIYAGIKPVLGPVTFDIGAVYYLYANGANNDSYELKLGASATPVTNLSVGGTLWFTPEQDNYVETYTIEGTAAYTLPAVGIFTPTISGLVGYTEDTETDLGFFAGGVDSYTYWNAGLALAVEKFTFDFRYWDTDISTLNTAAAGLVDERFVFTASVTLP